MILGAFLGGGIIALFGVAAGFWVIAVSSALAAVQYGRTRSVRSPISRRSPQGHGPRRHADRAGH